MRFRFTKKIRAKIDQVGLENCYFIQGRVYFRRENLTQEERQRILQRRIQHESGASVQAQ